MSNWYNVVGSNCHIAFDHTCVEGNTIRSLVGGNKVLVDGPITKKDDWYSLYNLNRPEESKRVKVVSIEVRNPSTFLQPIDGANAFTLISFHIITSISALLISKNENNWLGLSDNGVYLRFIHTWDYMTQVSGLVFSVLRFDGIEEKYKVRHNGQIYTRQGNNSYVPRTGELFTNINNSDETKLVSYAMYDAVLTDNEVLKVYNNILNDLFIENNSHKSIKPKTTYLNLLHETPVKYVKDSQHKHFGVHPYSGKDILINSKVYIAFQGNPEILTIKDIITEEDEPVVTDLFLINRKTGELVASTKSNERGEFEFKGIKADIDYIVLSPHPRYEFKSIAKDYLKREVK